MTETTSGVTSPKPVVTMVNQSPPCPSPNATTTQANGQQFCLRWNNYQTNLSAVFDQLLHAEAFVDVTLACQGSQFIKCHRVVLSACSPYFQNLLLEHTGQHPIIILRDLQFAELQALVEFMYKGEINVLQDQIPRLLRTAEILRIRGLAEVKNDDQRPVPIKRPVQRRTSTVNGGRNGEVCSPGDPAKKRQRIDTDTLHSYSQMAGNFINSLSSNRHGEDEIKPAIAEMIKEEERVSPRILKIVLPFYSSEYTQIRLDLLKLEITPITKYLEIISSPLLSHKA